MIKDEETGIEEVKGFLYNGKVYPTKEEAEIRWASDTVLNEYVSLEKELTRYYPHFITNIQSGGTNWGQVVVDKMVKYMELRTNLINLANKNNESKT